MLSNPNPNATSVQVLTKESTPIEIKTYFLRILKLKQSREQFPVNLDEVWSLVYQRRSFAIRALTMNTNFIEGIDYFILHPKVQYADYHLLLQNEKQVYDSTNGGAGLNKINYYLSVECLEYFIARKVRPVFEVYRKVFHKAVEEKATKKLSGQYIQVTGADKNLYMLSLMKAMREFLIEETKGNIFTELRLTKKIEAARTLFPESKQDLRSSVII